MFGPKSLDRLLFLLNIIFLFCTHMVEKSGVEWWCASNQCPFFIVCRRSATFTSTDFLSVSLSVHIQSIQLCFRIFWYGCEIIDSNIKENHPINCSVLWIFYKRFCMLNVGTQWFFIEKKDERLLFCPVLQLLLKKIHSLNKNAVLFSSFSFPPSHFFLFLHLYLLYSPFVFLSWQISSYRSYKILIPIVNTNSNTSWMVGMCFLLCSINHSRTNRSVSSWSSTRQHFLKGCTQKSEYQQQKPKCHFAFSRCFRCLQIEGYHSIHCTQRKHYWTDFEAENWCKRIDLQWNLFGDETINVWFC